MKLFELFEDDGEDKKTIQIRDPLARRLMDKARTEYAYTETDLEAFVKLTSDEQERDKKNIRDLEDQVDHATAVNKHQENQLKILKHQEAEDRRVHDEQRAKLDAIKAEIDSIEDRTDMLSLSRG
jgi:chromosome segregation ATPase